DRDQVTGARRRQRRPQVDARRRAVAWTDLIVLVVDLLARRCRALAALERVEREVVLGLDLKQLDAQRCDRLRAHDPLRNVEPRIEDERAVRGPQVWIEPLARGREHESAWAGERLADVIDDAVTDRDRKRLADLGRYGELDVGARWRVVFELLP